MWRVRRSQNNARQTPRRTNGTCAADLCAARSRLGLTGRSLALLNGLLTFHPETVLTGNNLVVFPSNGRLCLRAHGMPPSTMRRHLAVLVDAGVIIRRDSPNGKRYARKGRGGGIDHAFGFDLAPMIARAAEFAALAEEVRAEDQALRFARERITLARRDIVKIIATGLEEAVPVPATGQGPTSWEAPRALPPASSAIPRTPVLADVSRSRASWPRWQIVCSACWKPTSKIKNRAPMTPRMSATNRDQKPIPKMILNQLLRESRTAGPGRANPRSQADGRNALSIRHGSSSLPRYQRLRPGRDLAFWRDLTAAASVARAAMGISPSAWEAAQSRVISNSRLYRRRRDPAARIGDRQRRRDLRELTRKAEANEFSIGPMLMALIAAEIATRTRMRAGIGVGPRSRRRMRRQEGVEGLRSLNLTARDRRDERERHRLLLAALRARQRAVSGRSRAVTRIEGRSFASASTWPRDLP